MGHLFSFTGSENFEDVLDEDEMVDIVTFFYKWGDARFEIMCDGDSERTRGAHIYLPVQETHVITLSRRAIDAGVSRGYRLGGTKPAPTVRVGTAMVLTHEVQHANQAGLHRAGERFYTVKNYERRPCERDARAFVDQHTDQIRALLGDQGSFAEGTGVHRAPCTTDGLEDVADLFDELPEVRLGDLVHELRLSGLNSPKNVVTCREILEGRGVRVVR
jgi:hypothetical protein